MNRIDNYSESYLSEAFKLLRLLEDDINLADIGDEHYDLTEVEPDDVAEVPEEDIIDVDANSVDDLADTYEGKVILECTCCHTRIYKNAEDVIIEQDLANKDEACPVCGNQFGYTVIGKIGAYNKPEEAEEEATEEAENESLEEALPLADRLARKHIKVEELEDSEEDNLEEDCLKENDWDKLKAAYPELEESHNCEDCKEASDDDEFGLSGYEDEQQEEEVTEAWVGDDAFAFIGEECKLTVDGKDYYVIEADDNHITAEDKEGNIEEFDPQELANKKFSVVDWEGEYHEYAPDVKEACEDCSKDESLEEAEEDKEVCPECGKNPCECEKDDSLTEAVEMHADEEVNIEKHDDGSVDIHVGAVVPEAEESIVPLEPEEEAAIEANSEEEAEEPVEGDEVTGEEGAAEEEAPEAEEETTEEEVEEEPEAEEQEESLKTNGKPIYEEVEKDIDDVDEDKFDGLVEKFLNKVYDNVGSFKSTKIQDLGNKFIVEGVLNFKSGTSQKSSFVFEDAHISKRGKLVLEGYNTTFSGSHKAFSVRGTLDSGKYIAESMIYNYTVSQLNESNKNETVRVYGRVR